MSSCVWIYMGVRACVCSSPRAGAEVETTEVHSLPLAISSMRERTLSQRPHAPLDLPDERAPNRETIHPQEPRGPG